MHVMKKTFASVGTVIEQLREILSVLRNRLSERYYVHFTGVVNFLRSNGGFRTLSEISFDIRKGIRAPKILTIFNDEVCFSTSGFVKPYV